jgi:hypothetical protein
LAGWAGTLSFQREQLLIWTLLQTIEQTRGQQKRYAKASCKFFEQLTTTKTQFKCAFIFNR